MKYHKSLKNLDLTAFTNEITSLNLGSITTDENNVIVDSEDPEGKKITEIYIKHVKDPLDLEIDKSDFTQSQKQLLKKLRS